MVSSISEEPFVVVGAARPQNSKMPLLLKSQHGLINIRNAALGDGKHMWQVAKDTQILDPNAGYMYNLYCRQFADTCLVALNDADEIVGYIAGHLPPKKADTIFVWQIGVKPEYQHGGIGIGMLNALTDELEVRRLQATVTPHNVKGHNLFQKFAKEHGTDFTRTKDWMAEEDFPESEPKPQEQLYDIGPFGALGTQLETATSKCPFLAGQAATSKCPFLAGRSSAVDTVVPIGPSKSMLEAIEAIDNDAELGPFRSYVTRHNDDSEHVHLQGHDELKALVTKESNARTYVRRFPFVVQKAVGCTLTDSKGNQYLDFLGCAGTLALGHNHPLQSAAMAKHLTSQAPMQVLDMATEPKMEFVKELFTFMPAGMQDDYRVQFCGGSGSDAIDAAVKLCKIATGRSTVMCFHGAYHGMGQGPLAMMGNLGCKGPVQGLMPGVQFLPFPNSYRQPFGLATGEGGEGDKAVLSYIEHVLDDEESGVTKPACIVLEVVQGEGGLNAMSNWALQELRRITAERDIPMIIDEIQSGFCRSGNKFAFEHSGIIPDVVTLSKAAGGSQPLACVVYNKKLDKWGPGAHTGTFRGNGLAFSAGAATMKFMREERLWEKAQAKGELFTSLVAAGKSKYVADVRGFGLMIGMELVDPNTKDKKGMPVGCGTLCAQTQVECLKRGLIIERGGRGGSVLRPLPPLIVTEDEIKRGVAIILESIEAAAAVIFC